METMRNNKAMRAVSRYNTAKRTAEDCQELAANEEIQSIGLGKLFDQLSNIAQTIARQTIGDDFDVKAEQDFTKKPLSREQKAALRAGLSVLSKVLAPNETNQKDEPCSKHHRTN